MCCNQRRRQKYNFCFRLNCAHRATPYHYMAAMMITMMMLCMNEWIWFSVRLLFQMLKDIVSDFSLTTLSSEHIWDLRRFTFFVVTSRCHCRHLLTLQHSVCVFGFGYIFVLVDFLLYIHRRHHIDCTVSLSSFLVRHLAAVASRNRPIKAD